jgi:hypothetical protein
MRNTTKLKYILQLYTISLDMDDDGSIYLTIINKRTGDSQTFTDKAYSIVIGKAFGYMNKKMKSSENR